MIRRSATVLGCVLGLGAYAQAEPTGEASVADAERWSIAASTHLGPLEAYPRFGVAADVAYRTTSMRYRLELVLHPSQMTGIVTRTGTLLGIHVDRRLVRGRRLDWYAGGGIGIGLFSDDYDAAATTSDRMRVAAGLALETGAELRIGPQLRAFAGVRAVKYFASGIADDDWLAVIAGLRFAMEPRR